MRRNIALRLQYDGTAYHGWQVQKTDVTVAETLERALTKVCGEPIKVVGCGRTDAGVHAKRYCANFRTDCTIPIDRVPLAVNARLPADIAVVDAVAAPEDFNAIGSIRSTIPASAMHFWSTASAFIPSRWTSRGSSAPAAPLRARTTLPPCAPSAPRRARPCARCTGAVPSATGR